MLVPRREIKSLSTLFAFEAAGRLGSFTDAAKEMGVTQAAVSKQVAALEAEIGAALFIRHHRRVLLTDDGRVLLKVVNEALTAVAATLRSLRERRGERVVTIGATMAVSHFWLLPKLPAFRLLHPDAAIRVVSQEEAPTLANGEIDMAIRFGAGNWTDGRVHPLFGSEVYAMASPRFVARYGPVANEEAVMRLPLIAYDAPDGDWPDWGDWSRAAGVRERLPPPALSFNRYWDAIQAACTDQGALLAWNGFTGGMEENGMLLRLPGPVIAPRGSFHLVTGKRVETVEAARNLRDWLLSQAPA